MPPTSLTERQWRPRTLVFKDGTHISSYLRERWRKTQAIGRGHLRVARFGHGRATHLHRRTGRLSVWATQDGSRRRRQFSMCSSCLWLVHRKKKSVYYKFTTGNMFLSLYILDRTPISFSLFFFQFQHNSLPLSARLASFRPSPQMDHLAQWSSTSAKLVLCPYDAGADPPDQIQPNLSRSRKID